MSYPAREVKDQLLKRVVPLNIVLRLSQVMEKYYLVKKMCEPEEIIYRTYESYEQLTDLLVKD